MSSERLHVDIVEDGAVALLLQTGAISSEAEARRYLAGLKRAWLKQAAQDQLDAHDGEIRPHFHMGLPCQPGYGCYVRKIIAVVDPEVEL